MRRSRPFTAKEMMENKWVMCGCGTFLFCLTGVLMGLAVAIYVEYHSTQECSNTPMRNEAYYEKQETDQLLIRTSETVLKKRDSILSSPMGPCLRPCETAFCADPFAFSPRKCVPSESLLPNCLSFDQCVLDCHNLCLTRKEARSGCFTGASADVSAAALCL